MIRPVGGPSARGAARASSRPECAMPDHDPFSFSRNAFAAMNFGSAAEHGLAQFREGCESLRQTAEAGAGALDAAGATALRGAGDYFAKLMEIGRSSTQQAFELAEALLGSASLPAAAETLAAHGRRQIDALASHSQDLVALGHKVAGETAEPIRAAANRAFGYKV
jgi:hypothetical protein